MFQGTVFIPVLLQENISWFFKWKKTQQEKWFIQSHLWDAKNDEDVSSISWGADRSWFEFISNSRPHHWCWSWWWRLRRCFLKVSYMYNGMMWWNHFVIRILRSPLNYKKTYYMHLHSQTFITEMFHNTITLLLSKYHLEIYKVI